MKSNITIQEFLRKLRDSSQFNFVNDNIISNIKGVVTYIHPELEVVTENVSKPFIIISAPGAVGKTTFARYAAYCRKGYYWDLSTVKLGDNTFSGTLLETFGPKEISKVLDAIAKGEMTLFLDSLDEAEIISGWAGIEKFLTEVVRFTKNSPQSNIIIFSRSETALEIQMKLDEIGGNDCYSVYQIDYFAEEQAISFIENRILWKGSSNHAKFLAPFNRAVKSIFKTIGIGINDKVSELWDDDQIRCFLGYSPVLQTIGDFLCDQNYEEVEKQFQSKQNVESGLEIIEKFIFEILNREQGKFIKGLKEKVTAIPSDWNEWNNIYTPDDQIRFVLNNIAKRPLAENVTSSSRIPTWLEKGFTDSVKYFIQNHPFIKDGKYSSPAFRDYVLSKTINENNFEATSLKLLNSGSFVLTPLFSHFYRKFNSNICRASHAGFIYESVSSRTSLEGNTLLTYIRKSDQKTIFEIINSTGSKADSVSMECIINSQEPLTFFSRLSNTTIEIDSDVVLGRKEGSFEIQNVEIAANKITIYSKDFIVNCHDETDSALIATELHSFDPALEITKKGKGNFVVCGKGAQAYPWATYFKEYDRSLANDYKEELYILKRILEPFRKHGKGEFAKQYEFIDNEIVKNIPDRKNLLNFMIDLKIIKKGGAEDKKYFMYEDVSTQYGISWGGLKTLNGNQNINIFFKNFRMKYPKN